jgi:PAS domain S-box-containing protein
MNYAGNNKYSSFRIVLIYFVVAGLYIFVSDTLLFRFIEGDELQTRYQIIKGLMFVLITSLGLYYLIYKHDQEQQKLVHQKNVYDELLTKLFDRIPAMIAVYNPESRRFRVNREFEKKTGWTNEDAKEISLVKACYPDPEIRKKVAEFMSKPGSGWREFETTTKDGGSISTRWTNISLSDDTQVGIGIDLTELKEKEAEIMGSQMLLQKTFDSLKESVIILDPKTRTVTDCNKANKEIFGYARVELIGKNTRLLHVDEEKYREFHERSHQKLVDTGSFKTEYKMRRKNGEVFDSDHTVTFVYDETGDPQRVVSVIRDITHQKEYERQLKQSLQEKETLLMEIHHRVKNNLAVISGMIHLQALQEEDERVREKMLNSTGRIKTMANIHELLYQAESFTNVRLDQNIELLVNNIQESYGAEAYVATTFNLEPTEININQAIPFSLIINEVITNVLKHGYGKGDKGTMSVGLNERDRHLTITIEDDGRGLPDNFEDVPKDSMGMELIDTLAVQLKANYSYERLPKGTRFSLTFEKSDRKGSASSSNINLN